MTDNAKWAPVIGRYMIAFGEIESSVNELLRNIIPEGAMKVVVGLQLGQRIKLLREGLPDWKDLSDVNQSVVAQNLEEAAGLMGTRNLIAHNPLILSLFTQDGKPKRSREEEEVIWSEHSGKAITFAELRKLTARAELVANALLMNWLDYDVAALSGHKPVLKRP
jgi:hypothetical protein